ncbi:hypothetical protein [Anaerotignum sp.]
MYWLTAQLRKSSRVGLGNSKGGDEEMLPQELMANQLKCKE